jgi:hypothetical protein
LNGQGSPSGACTSPFIRSGFPSVVWPFPRGRKPSTMVR